MDYKRRIRNFDLNIPNKLPLLENISVPLDLGLTAGSHSLAQLLAEQFNLNLTEYDKAIDAVYNNSHLGSSMYHHLIDGQHSLLGAFEAVRDVHTDDSFVSEIVYASEHLLRDTMSIAGINPFFSLGQEHFDQLAKLAQNFGVSKPFLADALTMNGPELLGGTIALGSTLILGKSADPSRLSYLSGAYMASAIASANPLLLPIAAGGLVYSMRKEEDKKKVLVKAGKGALVSGSALLVSSIVGGPVWLTCAVAIGTAVAVREGIERPGKAFERMQQVITPASRLMRKVVLAL